MYWVTCCVEKMVNLQTAAKDVVNVWDALTTDNLERIEPYIEALRQALAEPDTGIDRGAWADVPDATKWVDELRGDEPEFECPRCGHCCQFVEPPNSTTDVVEPEPVAWVKLDEGMIISHAELSDGSGVDMDLSNWTPLYAAPPKREWQSLTDYEIYPMYCEPRSDAEMIAFAREFEAKLKEKNT